MTSPVGNNLPVYDHLQLGMNPNLLALLDQLCLENGEQAVETVKFAAMAFKINPMKRRQSRVLLITDKALYNLKKDSYASFRRRIPIEHLRGMVIARNSNEIVFQIQDGYDYHYIVDNRLGVVEVTGTYYERLTNRKFEVCISEDSSLTSYVLTKTEWKNSAPELIKRRSSTHPEKVFHPKSTTANWIKHNLKTLFHSKTSEVDSVTKSGWLTYENDSTWQQYFTLLKPRSLLFLKAKHKGAFDASDVELGNEIESDTSALTLSDSSGHTFSLKGREEPPKFCFSVFNDKLKKVIRLGSSDKDELANWKDALQDLGNMPDNGSKDGWLFKQDHGEKIWRRYYFVLQSQTCAYFDMDVEQEIGLRSFHAEAVLDVACATIAVNGSGIGALSQNGFPFRFTIRDGCKSYHLASDSEKTRENWIWAINAAIEEENGSIEVSIAPKSIPDQSFENSQVTQITLVVSDVQGSTMLWEREPGAMNVALEMHDHILRSALGRCNGYEVKTEGDAFVVAFIEALDAIRWCVSAQYDLLKAEWPSSLANCYDAHNEYGVGIGSAEAVVTTSKLFAGLRVRMGIHTGTPRKRRNSITNRIDYSGTDVHLTSRISSAAHGGQIICSDAVVKAVNTKMKEDDDFSVVRLPGSYKLQRVRNPSTVVLYEIWPKGLQGRKLLLPPLRACRVSVNLQRSHTGSTEEPKRNKDDLEKSEKALAQLTWDEKCRVSNSWSHPQIKPRPPKVIMANTT